MSSPIGCNLASEASKLGTRVLTCDKVRLDPHAPESYDATITYDLVGFNRQVLCEEQAACAVTPDAPLVPATS